MPIEKNKNKWLVVTYEPLQLLGGLGEVIDDVAGADGEGRISMVPANDDVNGGGEVDSCPAAGTSI